MQILKEEVKEEILYQARLEFRKKGFRAASLRQIAAKAGMTVGNIYRYFGSKDELFREILAPVIGNIELMKLGLNSHKDTEKGSDQEEHEHNKIFISVFNFIERHRQDLRLLLSGSGGSSLENFQEELIRWYGDILLAEMKKGWKQMQVTEPEISPATIYLIAKSVAETIIESIRNEYSQEEIRQVAADMQKFFEGGTKSLMLSKIKR